jgi:hypothetical protein
MFGLCNRCGCSHELDSSTLMCGSIGAYPVTYPVTFAPPCAKCEQLKADLAALQEQRCETCRYRMPDNGCGLHDSRLRDDGNYEYVPCADFGHRCGAWARREP